MTMALAILLKPLFLFLLLIPGAIATALIRRKMRDGKLKRFLLRK